MAIFIDPPTWPAHGRRWSHLVSDSSLEELHAFAAAHGIPRRGFERDHYDVPADAYDELVAAGATPVTGREVIRLLEASGLRRRKAVAPARRSPGRELLRPPRLQAGDRVRVVATAGEIPEGRLRQGEAVLESWGLEVVRAPHVLDQLPELGYLAGTDFARAHDFTAAWADSEIAAIFAARGGYGTQRMVDQLDFRRLAEAPPKLVVGFSDLTAMHQALASRLGVVSVHGHVVTSLGDAEPASAERLRRLLMEPDGVLDLLPGEVATVVAGQASGVLLGGNLTMLSAEIGSPNVRVARGGIAVIEEVAEDPYRIDRQLTQLLRSGWFDGVRGIVCGAFTDCGDPVVVERVLVDRLAGLGVPMVLGADIGHSPTTLPIPFGVLARLDASAGSLTLERAALAITPSAGASSAPR